MAFIDLDRERPARVDVAVALRAIAVVAGGSVAAPIIARIEADTLAAIRDAEVSRRAREGGFTVEARGRAPPRAALPGDAQTPEFIAAWMRAHAAPGVIVVVRHRQLGLYEYLLDEVRRVDPRLKRIYLSDHGAFSLEGEYLAPPRNRFGLLAPVGDVLDAAVRGQGWLHGQAVFQRPSSTHERTLISAARRQQAERG